MPENEENQGTNQPNPAPQGGESQGSSGGEPGQQGGEGGSGERKEGAGEGEPRRDDRVPLAKFIELRNELRDLKRTISQPNQGGHGQQGGGSQRDPDPEPQELAYSDFNQFMVDKAAWAGRKAGREAYVQSRAADESARRANESRAHMENLQSKYEQNTAGESDAFHDAAQNLALGNLWLPIMESENPVPIVKHFIANKAEARRFASMPPAKQLVEFGRLCAKLDIPHGGGGEPQKRPGQGVPDMEPAGRGSRSSRDPYSEKTSVDDFISLTRPLPGGGNTQFS